MKNLNLNAYGVNEMSAAEMQKVDGGFFDILGAICFIAILVVGYLTNDPAPKPKPSSGSSSGQSHASCLLSKSMGW